MLHALKRNIRYLHYMRYMQYLRYLCYTRYMSYERCALHAHLIRLRNRLDIIVASITDLFVGADTFADCVNCIWLCFPLQAFCSPLVSFVY